VVDANRLRLAGASAPGQVDERAADRLRGARARGQQVQPLSDASRGGTYFANLLGAECGWSIGRRRL
jgi:hypothetical protein